VSDQLLTAAELAPILRRSPERIRIWKRTGVITAEVDTGYNILFDLDTVKQQLAAKAKKKAKAGRGANFRQPVHSRTGCFAFIHLIYFPAVPTAARVCQQSSFPHEIIVDVFNRGW